MMLSNEIERPTIHPAIKFKLLQSKPSTQQELEEEEKEENYQISLGLNDAASGTGSD